MAFEQFILRHRFASLLVGMHAVLLFVWAWIELDGAWNDMNPTMLVWAAFYVVDYPIHWALNPWVDSTQQTGTYLVLVLLFGSVYWFAIGSLVARAFNELCRLCSGRHQSRLGA